MVRTWSFHCSGWGSVPGWGTEIPQAMVQLEKKKKEIIEQNVGGLM